MYKFLIFYILLLAAGTSINLPLFGKEVQLSDFFFVFILARIIWNMRRGSGIVLLKPPPTIRNLIVVLLILLLAACAFSSNVPKSFMEFTAISYLVILYLWVGGIRIEEKGLKWLLHFWLYLSLGLCILALGGLISYTFFEKGSRFVQIYPQMRSLIPFSRLTATFPTMNMFASFLHVGIVFFLALITYERWRPRYIFLGGLILICAFLTASRNLLGIFITIFLALLPIRSRPGLTVFKYLAFSLSLLFLFLVLTTTIWCIFPTQVNYDRQSHKFSLSVNATPSLYAILNKMSIRFIKRNPLLGIGAGMFNQTAMEQLDWNEVKDSYKVKGFANRNVFLDPHNTYLGWAAEAGLPFVVALVSLFYSITRVMWKGYKARVNSFARSFCYVCICGMIGFMVNGLYVDILTMRHFWLMMALGTLVATHCLKEQDGDVVEVRRLG